MATLSASESLLITQVVRGLPEEEEKLTVLRLIAKGANLTIDQIKPTLPEDSTIKFLDLVSQALAGSGEKSPPKKKAVATTSSGDTKVAKKDKEKDDGKKCEAKLGTGAACTCNAKPGSKYCGKHKNYGQ